MEWRCTWCGKPHAEDDPPCDECGHNKFERAVEQINTETVPSEPIWVCTECGRQHQKHSPPCSRCGNVELEQRRPDYDDLEELGGTSYLDVLEPKYAAGYVAVAILGGVLLLAYAGVITLPGMGGVPGEGGQVGDVSLDAVEREYVAALDERVTGPVRADGNLSRAATAYNEQVAVAQYEGGDLPTAEGIRDRVDLDCDDPVFVPYLVQLDRPVEEYDARSLAVAALPSDGAPAERPPSADVLTALESENRSRIGVDVRVAPRDDDAPDRLLVTAAVC